MADVEINGLLTASLLKFNPQIRAKIVKTLKEKWGTLRDSTPLNVIKKDIAHPCIHDLLQEQVDTLQGKLEYAKPPVMRPDEYVIYENGLIEGFCRVITINPFKAMKENFIFDSAGNVTDVRGLEFSRWSKACTDALLTSKSARLYRMSEQSAAMTSPEWNMAAPPLPPSLPLSPEALAKIKTTEAAVRSQTRSAGRRRKHRKTKRSRRKANLKMH